LDDKRRRYLRQQAELGGVEVYLLPGQATARQGNAPVAVVELVEGVGQPIPEAVVEAATEAAPAPTRVAEPIVPPPAASGAVADLELAPPPTAAPIHQPLPPAQPDEPPSPRVEEMAKPKTFPKWRKDAPPIPGPGLTILPPDAGLLGDELSRLESLDAVSEMIRTCRKCRLCEGRINTVPGEGNQRARLMCVGEGPGATEDETGRPFVGAAGQLLDQILGAIDCPRDTVYIANIVKCRPPQNRKPLPDEATACLPYLHRQIALVRPKVLLALGGTAAEWMLGVRKSLGDLRGQVHRFAGIPLVVTYHPAALLRNPNWKKPTWDDVRIARQLLGD
jgi:DNA polymerase